MDGLTPRKTFVMNHFFEPMPDRGIGVSDPRRGPVMHWAFSITLLGEPLVVDKKVGRLEARVRVEQLAPYIEWSISQNSWKSQGVEHRLPPARMLSLVVFTFLSRIYSKKRTPLSIRIR